MTYNIVKVFKKGVKLYNALLSNAYIIGSVTMSSKVDEYLNYMYILLSLVTKEYYTYSLVPQI